MNSRPLRLGACVALSLGLAYSQDTFPERLAAEQPSSWVARLWSSVFGPTGRPVLDPAIVPLYLPPPPPAPCLIKPLSPVEDEVALAFETGFGELGRVHLAGLTRPTARALTRFDRLVSTVGGSFTVTSAHRPVAYQQHLQEVWDKWMEVRDLADPACSEIRGEAEREFLSHGLLETQRPATFSDHTRGIAFDARIELPPNPRLNRRRVSVDSLAKMAGLFRPVVLRDPVHFRLRRS